MRHRITFAAGLAVGYVLGTRAGRNRYEQLSRTVRRIAENPRVRETAHVVGDRLNNAGSTIYDKTTERLPVSSMRDFLARPTAEENVVLDQVDGHSLDEQER
ncbi:hypothetical protein [Salinactinospora qingdaonensis]|uniref:YtxH-like protein n=1 Tax=Salinactinospora qingdaonensis TaxID=702744 RepID=A0ABP7FZ32_9ACTN